MSRSHRNSRKKTTHYTCGAIALVLFLLATAMNAAPEAAPEYDVKAAMLYNFAKFVEWPQSTWKDARAPLAICLAGANPFGDSLEKAIEGQDYGGRPIRVQRVNALTDLETCHVVFVARSESKRLPEILRATENRPMLTVSDADRFARDGGMIGFVTVDHKIRFSVNPARATKAGITISSKLLRLASTVEGTP